MNISWIRQKLIVHLIPYLQLEESMSDFLDNTVSAGGSAWWVPGHLLP